MNNKSFDYVIVGAGLAGLTFGYELYKRGIENFKILEARDRIGGRIHTVDGIDLGATWFQDHHAQLKKLIEELGIEIFRQYSKGRGIFIYSSMAPAQYFESDSDTPSGYRIEGGSKALVDALAENLSSNIQLNTTIDKIAESGAGALKVISGKVEFLASNVILALPPQLITNIQIKPQLPDTLKSAIRNTHTWMSNAIKVGITYQRPFWREKNLSGTLIGHVSPVIEIYDHSNIEDSEFSLMGFVNEGLRDEKLEDRKKRIIDYLLNHLGAEARNYTSYIEKDWSLDESTSSQKLKSVYISPRYGNPIFKQSFLSDRLFIIGAETANQHGGYMDGAVISAKEATQSIIP